MKLLDYIDYDPLTDPALLPTAEVPTVRIPRVLAVSAILEGSDADAFERVMAHTRETADAALKRLLRFYVAANASEQSEIVHVLERTMQHG